MKLIQFLKLFLKRFITLLFKIFMALQHYYQLSHLNWLKNPRLNFP